MTCKGAKIDLFTISTLAIANRETGFELTKVVVQKARNTKQSNKIRTTVKMGLSANVEL